MPNTTPITPNADFLAHIKKRYELFNGRVVNIRTNRIVGYIDLNGLTSNRGAYRKVCIYFNGKYITVKEHHLVWFLCHGVWPECELDHKNQDKCDNRIENLEYSDRTNQQLNSSRQHIKSNKLPRGVYRRRKQWSYEATITLKGKSNYLGTFPTLCPAFEAYKTEYTKHYGIEPNMFH